MSGHQKSLVGGRRGYLCVCVGVCVYEEEEGRRMNRASHINIQVNKKTFSMRKFVAYRI